MSIVEDLFPYLFGKPTNEGKSESSDPELDKESPPNIDRGFYVYHIWVNEDGNFFMNMMKSNRRLRGDSDVKWDQVNFYQKHIPTVRQVNYWITRLEAKHEDDRKRVEHIADLRTKGY